MNIVETFIPGLKILNSKIFQDSRGEFIKVFNDVFFKEHGMEIEIKESYYSISHKNVIRGMHFQKPPYDHVKLVFVTSGSILDVVLDMRKNSKTFGKYFSINLKANDGQILLIPKGLAHGFKSLEDNSIVHYMQTTCYAPDYDDGIRYDSFGFDWKCENPIVSKRDLSFVNFNNKGLIWN